MNDLTLVERLRSDRLMIPTHEAADRIEELEALIVPFNVVEHLKSGGMAINACGGRVIKMDNNYGVFYDCGQSLSMYQLLSDDWEPSVCDTKSGGSDVATD